jgi:hypothetical protein
MQFDKKNMKNRDLPPLKQSPSKVQAMKDTGLKSGLKGKSYDEQKLMLKPDKAVKKQGF